MKLQYVATEEYMADVLMKPLAILKFEYFREKLGVLQIKVSSKRNLDLSNSYVRAEQFYHGERIGSFHVIYECGPLCLVGYM